MRLPPAEARQVETGKRTAWLFPSPQRTSYEVGRSVTCVVDIPRGEDEDELTMRVVVTNVEQTQLHEIDYRTMKAAGFKYREDLHAYWTEHYRDPGPPDAPKPTPVLVVRFQLDRRADRRYMRPTGSRSDYIVAADDEVPRGAMPDEPECVPEAFQRALSDDLRRRDFDERQRRRELLLSVPLPDRLATAMARARHEGVDISRQLAIIAKRVEAIERIVDHEAA